MCRLCFDHLHFCKLKHEPLLVYLALFSYIFTYRAKWSIIKYCFLFTSITEELYTVRPVMHRFAQDRCTFVN